MKDLEAETRAEVRRARFGGTQECEQTTQAIKTAKSMRSHHTPERDESQEPVPHALPKLLAHEKSSIDGKYFTAMS